MWHTPAATGAWAHTAECRPHCGHQTQDIVLWWLMSPSPGIWKLTSHNHRHTIAENRSIITDLPTLQLVSSLFLHPAIPASITNLFMVFAICWTNMFYHKQIKWSPIWSDNFFFKHESLALATHSKSKLHSLTHTSVIWPYHLHLLCLHFYMFFCALSRKIIA